MITVKKYSDEHRNIWNEFCKNAKNSLFMFQREYMEYHKNRFKDHSLLFYDNDELIAVLPISQNGNIFISHGGLTYGGFITGEKIKQHSMNECFDVLFSYCKDNNINKVIYKTIPHIFHKNPAEEELYALFIKKADVLKIEPSTVLDLKNPFRMPKGRKSQISRAKREGVVVEKTVCKEDYINFIDLENKILKEIHNTTAVHTAEEIYYLHTNFPENIHLYTAKLNDEIIAGSIVYEYDQVIHTQYLAANEEARKIGALDLTIFNIISEYKESKEYLDFGISSENGGLILNEGLISQKEGFGGRTNVYKTFELVF